MTRRDRSASPPARRLRVRILAGPYQAFAPLWIPEDRFGAREGEVEIVPLPTAWIPRGFGRQSHRDLFADVDDARVRVAARIIREDIAATKLPLLVLPDLSRQVLAGVAPAPGCVPVTDLLRRLQSELGDADLDVRLVALEGLDTAAQRAAIDADLLVLRERLGALGLQQVSTSIRFITPTHRAFWRAAVNRLTSMGDDAGPRAERLLAGLSADELAAAALDHDGRQVFEMAPPAGFVLPAAPPTAAADVEERPPVPVTIVAPADAHGRPSAPVSRRIDLNGRRITFVCEKLAERSGGAERVLIELANALCRRGYQVDVVSHERRGKPPFYPLEFGVVHTNLSTRRGARTRKDRVLQRAETALKSRALPFPLDRLAFRIRYAGFHQRLAEHIDAARPDVVVPFMPPAIVATALARTQHRARRVASMHNAPEQDFENPERWDPGVHARRRRLELMDRIDTIAVLLPSYQEWYPPALRERTTVVPNAVVPIAEDSLAGAQRRPTILAVGRLADTKRHDLTLRAFAALAADFPEWNLRILGVGPQADHLTALRDELGLRGRAELPGHTSAIADEYLSASILCHPARFEGFPLAVTESLASGLPVVGFADCSGVNSLVVNDENGALVDPGDGSDSDRLAGLTDALRRLMADESLRLTLGKGGPVSMEPYAPEHVVDTWERVLFPE